LRRCHGFVTLHCGRFCKRAQITWCIFNFLNFVMHVPPSMFLIEVQHSPRLPHILLQSCQAMFRGDSMLLGHGTWYGIICPATQRLEGLLKSCPSTVIALGRLAEELSQHRHHDLFFLSPWVILKDLSKAEAIAKNAFGP